MIPCRTHDPAVVTTPPRDAPPSASAPTHRSPVPNPREPRHHLGSWAVTSGARPPPVRPARLASGRQQGGQRTLPAMSHPPTGPHPGCPTSSTEDDPPRRVVAHPVQRSARTRRALSVGSLTHGRQPKHAIEAVRMPRGPRRHRSGRVSRVIARIVAVGSLVLCRAWFGPVGATGGADGGSAGAGSGGGTVTVGAGSGSGSGGGTGSSSGGSSSGSGSGGGAPAWQCTYTYPHPEQRGRLPSWWPNARCLVLGHV